MLKLFRLVSNFSILMLLLLFTSGTYAQSTGIISGIVVDSKSGNYLPGANVMLRGTNKGAATDKDGSFRIVNVLPGNYALLVRYLGYKTDTISVAVKSGITTNVNIKLTVSYISMKDVVVSGLRQGQVKALSIQRESNTIVDVVSSEQMKTFPDANAADVLQRIPGVFIERSAGDGRYVLIRGTEPRLTNVTVNGNPLATNRNQERYDQMDIVGSNQMSLIEVVKALTPDMDANAIGGTVNIVTKSAFDYPGPNLDITAGSGYSNLGKKPLYQGNLDYSTRFGAKNNFGISITGNWDQRDRRMDEMEFGWQQEQDVNKNIIPYGLSEVDLEDFQISRERYGLGASFEYRPDENNKFYFKSMWNQLNNGEIRARTRLRVDKGNYLDPTGLLTQKSQIIRESTNELEKQYQSNFDLGGANRFGDLSVDYDLAYSYGNGNRQPDMVSTWTLDQKVNLALDLSNSLYPKYQVTNLDKSYEFDASNYGSPTFNYEDFNATNEYKVGGLNLKYPYEILGYPATVKGGFKYTNDYKNNHDNRWAYSWNGATPLTMANFLSSRQINDFMNNNYVFGPEVDGSLISSFMAQNMNTNPDLQGQYDYWNSIGQWYDVTENISAAYLMTTIHFGELSLLAGVRDENTSDNCNGYELIFDTKGNFSSVSPVTVIKKYNDLFPMVHLIYDLGEMTKVRLAVTRTMSRPNFWDLVPYFYLDDKHQRIKSGNSDLIPTYATNVDFIASHYFSGIGIASANFFYKSLTNIIFEKVSILPNGVYAGYQDQRMINGGNANLYGFELNWQQELTFLPGLLSGFGIYVNYTHTWAKADLVGRQGFLPGQAGDIGNLSLSYEMGGFQARLSYAYQGKFITEVGISEGYDYYTAAHGEFDFSATQKLLNQLKAFLEVVNINNEPDREYVGVAARPLSTQFFSWYSRIGLKYSL